MSSSQFLEIVDDALTWLMYDSVGWGSACNVSDTCEQISLWMSCLSSLSILVVTCKQINKYVNITHCSHFTNILWRSIQSHFFVSHTFNSEAK